MLIPLVQIIQTDGNNPFPNLQIPKNYLPWIRVDLTKPPTFITRYKLKHLAGNYEECKTALNEANIEFRSLPDKTEGSCPLENRVIVDQSQYPYSAAVGPTCPMAAAITMWETQIVQKAAEKHLDSAISKIQQAGIFSCRNIAGSKRRSQHAHANAIDISGFTLKNGSTISLLRDWGKDTPAGRFLQDVRNGSCDIFSGVLGPEYNKAHANHFHLDLGPYSICS